MPTGTPPSRPLPNRPLPSRPLSSRPLDSRAARPATAARRASAVALATGAFLLAGAAPAAADHVHFRVVGNGSCVLLAQNGSERFVALPHADAYPAGRQHPLHVNVHLARPGKVQQVQVAYTAHGTLTPAAVALCDGMFRNR